MALCMLPFGVVEGCGVVEVGRVVVVAALVVVALVVVLVVVDGCVSHVWWCAHKQWCVGYFHMHTNISKWSVHSQTVYKPSHFFCCTWACPLCVTLYIYCTVYILYCIYIVLYIYCTVYILYCIYCTVYILYCIYYVLTCILKDQLQPVATSLCTVYKYS
jgi:hypothetical protein